MFEEMVDDAPDSNYLLFLMNAAKNEVEAGRDWNFNRNLDISKSTASGDTYLSTKPLPSDFLSVRKLYLQGDINPWTQIAFEFRDRFKDIYKRFYIDNVNNVFALCGSQSAVKVIYMFYGRSTPDITLTSSPVWPSVFHPYLVFKMAEMWASGSDADEVNYRMSKENLRQAAAILKGFIQWDARLKVSEYNAKNERMADLSSYPDVVGQEFLP